MEKNYQPDYQQILKHSLLLLSVVGLVFLWAVSPYHSFATQIIATLLALFVTKHLFRHHLTTRQESLLDSLILTGLILVIVSATGGLASPVFFLIYFLLFALSLLLEPTIPLILSFSLIIFFLFTTAVSKTSELLPLFSFPLITPLAVYFGRQHKAGVYQKHDILHLKESVRRETEDVLFWLTTTFSREMGKISETLEKFPNISNLQKPYLETIQKELARLKKLGEKLKQAIEED